MKTGRLEALAARIAQWLCIPAEDAELIDFILAVYKSHEIPGDPLWAIIIDASGGGKTELLRTLRHRKDAYFLSKLTEKTLISGYRDPKKPEDPSLLPQLNGKVAIIKDLAPLLAMRRESRSQIIADLRDAYDGFTDQGRGNVGKVSYESRFTLLAASTLAIERADAVDQELGERFIKFRARGGASLNKVRKALSNLGSDDDMRGDIESAISEYLDSLPSCGGMSIPADLQEALANLADFAAKARSHVARDRDGALQYKPRAEVGTRLGKELGKLLMALACVRGKSQPDGADFATVVRVAEDCIPPNRFEVLNALLSSQAPMSQAKIEELTDFPHSTTSRVLDDLKVLGIADSKQGWSLVMRWKPAPPLRPAAYRGSGFLNKGVASAEHSPERRWTPQANDPRNETANGNPSSAPTVGLFDSERVV